MRIHKLLPLLIFCTILSACSRGEDSSQGFSLPEGDVAAGKDAFVSLQCNACHVTQDIDKMRIFTDDTPTVRLGGNVSRVKTYAELLTSIINPSHRLAPGYPSEKVADGDTSKMRNYNNVMTVEQLINLVSYLQTQYQLRPYTITNYPVYYR